LEDSDPNLQEWKPWNHDGAKVAKEILQVLKINARDAVVFDVLRALRAFAVKKF
jgi:hypothetical protein